MTSLIRARIDAAILRANLQVLRQRAGSARILAVVKANAYGHGLVATAAALRAADGFAVARLEEGVALREAGVAQRIVLLEGVFSREQLFEAASQGLDLVVHSPEQLQLLESHASGATGASGLHLWLKADTGMNRLGFRPEDFAGALQRVRSLGARVAELRVMTHLACADSAEHLQTTQLQLQRFNSLLGDFNGETSIANSAAVLNLPQTCREWIRPGLALYGISPFAAGTGRDFGLLPAMTLESTVIALRQVPAGEAVGYGAAWRAARPSTIAIVAAGYGDGLLRSLAGGGSVWLRGRRLPFAGRVSMDMVAVDATAAPEVLVGDRVELWGQNLPVEELARAADTIPWELLCAVRQRVPLIIEDSGRDHRHAAENNDAGARVRTNRLTAA